MRKLDLRDYETSQNMLIKGEVTRIAGTYCVKDSVLNILFLPSLQLQGALLVKQNILAMKIEESNEFVLLEEEEYQRVLAAANNYPAQGRQDVEFIDRIINQTPEIDIKEGKVADKN